MLPGVATDKVAKTLESRGHGTKGALRLTPLPLLEKESGGDGGGRLKLKSRSHLLCAHYLCNVARVSKLGAYNVNGSFRIAKNLEPIRIEIFPKSAPVAPVESLILDQTPNPRICLTS